MEHALNDMVAAIAIEQFSHPVNYELTGPELELLDLSEELDWVIRFADVKQVSQVVKAQDDSTSGAVLAASLATIAYTQEVGDASQVSASQVMAYTDQAPPRELTAADRECLRVLQEFMSRLPQMSPASLQNLLGVLTRNRSPVAAQLILIFLTTTAFVNQVAGNLRAPPE